MVVRRTDLPERKVSCMQKKWFVALFTAALLLAVSSAAANPAPSTHTCGKPYCYWETPMDISDIDTIWNMLIQPMVVVEGWQKSQEKLYAQPDENSEPVGEVTCESQGVHVLETLDNGWSLVECYSSSSSISRVKVYGDLVEGYIRTEKLVEVETRTRYGLVVDKLAQRMYVFEEGKLLSSLRISTGKPLDWRPYYETSSGEFHLVSMVGSFVDNGVICENAIRFNDGDLIHCVPYEVAADGSKNYWNFEGKLGQRASNGCIRVQRRLTPEAINMLWVWNHLFDQKQTRLVIWEDCPGRQLSVPPPDMPIYVRLDISRAYHRSPECYNIAKRCWPLDRISYAQLEDGPYAKLTDCYYCNPPLRRSVLEELNRQYAEAAQAPVAAVE